MGMEGTWELYEDAFALLLTYYRLGRASSNYRHKRGNEGGCGFGGSLDLDSVPDNIKTNVPKREGLMHLTS